jgi:drug/metabolite transporter (DMT)-like permease
MKTAVVLTLAIAAQAAGNVYLSKGMRDMAGRIGNADLPLILLRGIESPTIWLGTTLLLAFFLLYAAALSWADLSFVLPATAFGYAVNVACGHYFLNEAVTPARWAGASLISIGVILVARSGPVRSGQ